MTNSALIIAIVISISRLHLINYNLQDLKTKLLFGIQMKLSM